MRVSHRPEFSNIIALLTCPLPATARCLGATEDGVKTLKSTAPVSQLTIVYRTSSQPHRQVTRKMQQHFLLVTFKRKPLEENVTAMGVPMSVSMMSPLHINLER